MMERDLGVQKVRAFLIERGGREFEVPSRPDPDPTREWLRRVMGKGRITVPKGPTSHAARQRLAILQNLREGRSISQTAFRVGCHLRTVRRRKVEFIERNLLISPTKDTAP
ncbi:helix-turn-helix domain-containing protein [Pseudaestuariivita sp.]|uniref:helix-turn-helix domain-containing protein n=1 Tax=Pseudaestuariivita sp. TaxID=2211669 RepID=UPI004059B2CC